MPEAPNPPQSWLSDALGAPVESARFEKIGTFSTELWRIHLRGEPSLPSSLVLKRAVPGRDDRIGESFANEVRFYREASPRIGARVPRYYAGIGSAHTWDREAFSALRMTFHRCATAAVELRVGDLL
jgi:hypothetical protein